MTGSSISFPWPATFDFFLVSSWTKTLIAFTAILRREQLLLNIFVHSVSDINWFPDVSMVISQPIGMLVSLVRNSGDSRVLASPDVDKSRVEIGL